MSTSTGVNPIEAMNEAEQAEELAIRTTSATPALEDITDELKEAVSSYVASGVESFEIKTFDNIMGITGHGRAARGLRRTRPVRDAPEYHGYAVRPSDTGTHTARPGPEDAAGPDTVLRPQPVGVAFNASRTAVSAPSGASQKTM
ncbi:hypothetical protein [Nocardiopsis listeri]|uniref:hypothetical protein n=1 Tax=Nocardiopsis listeri TaxID=53440 RepID=UPI0012EED084|nr:hypothetical protein [Nocardiopsis listeri]